MIISEQGYIVMINDIILPVTPEKITIKIKGKNKVYTLASCEEINALNLPGLTEYEFDILLPAHGSYPFSRYINGYLSQAWFLAFFADIVTSRKPCTLRIVRSSYISRSIVTSARTAMSLPYNQNVRVSIESYTIKEDSAYGQDVTVNLKLKQFVDYGTKTVAVLGDGKTVTVVSNAVREADNAPKKSTYTVQKNDTILTLWKLAKKYTGDASNYWEIMTSNNISGALLEEGQVLKLPW